MSLVAHISRSALEHNLRALSDRSAPAAVMFVVKANGYGHGAVDVAAIAHGVGIRHFGCLEIETALSVRAVVPDPSVQLLAWQFSERDDLSVVAANGIDLGVGSTDLLDVIERAHVDGTDPIRVHLKVDTGLNRNGVPQNEWAPFVERVVDMDERGIVTAVGIWTHIAETSDEADIRAREQFETARNVAESALGRTLFAHLAASSASFRLPDFRFDAVRIGGHAYGIPSFDDVTPADMGLRPVMTLTADATADHDEEWGDVTSVNGGFADGVPGYAAGLVSLTVEGVRHPIAAVLEDEIIATGRPAGTRAYLFGDGSHGEQTVREWGDAMGTLGDEITCRISPLVPRVIAF